ncbi:hypothetical protein C8Q80DRAFT_1274816 [Daedaleopsis nitida]|nr:hypothetical protein C8Q80DRAFT_1274816 [Daedaleopsis nitida]
MRGSNPQGPFYVILGGTQPEILTSRPPRIVQKQFKPLLPIVVTCTCLANAQAVLKLNDLIKNIDPEDAHTLAYTVQNSDLDIVGTQFSNGDTGVFDGINWQLHLRHLIDPRSSTWCKPGTMKEAIVFMLSKPGYNFPLITNGDPIPSPPEPVPDPVPAAPSAAPVYQAWGNPPTPSARRAAGRRDAAVLEPSVKSTLAQALRTSLRVDEAAPPPLEIQILHQIIRPLLLPGLSISQVANAGPAISFGQEADDMLTMRNVSDANLLKILRARVYADDYPSFSKQMGLALGWSPYDSYDLWKAMKLTCV